MSSSEDNCDLDPFSVILSNMEFLEQFADSVIDYTSRYNHVTSVSYCPENITGKPSRYPQYGDFPDTYMLRTYGTWWSSSESKQPNYMPQDCEDIVSEDYITVKFEYPVLPVKLLIYETFNPGSIVRIYGRHGDEWSLLFEQRPENTDLIPPETARCFNPTLRPLKGVINEVRLEFNQSRLKYYTAIDAILMGGYRPLTKIQHYLLSSGMDNVDNSKQLLPLDAIADGKDYFNILPYETLVHIFKYLDLKSLLRCALVCHRFLEVTLDPTIYQGISLKKYWMKVDNNTLLFFKRRCKMLKRLDISWCGANFAITENYFNDLLLNCAVQLTHLSLCNCLFVRNISFGAISQCKELVDLRLRYCSPSPWTFTFLGELSKLEALDLCGTSITNDSLVKTLKANRNMKHLIIDYCDNLSSADEVMEALGVYNPDLVTLSCWKMRSLTSYGVKQLAGCSKLQELDMGWCLVLRETANCLEKIAHGCKSLRRLILSNWRGLNDHELLPIVYCCKELTQLDVLGILNITGDVISFALSALPNLQLLEVSFCGSITIAMVGDPLAGSVSKCINCLPSVVGDDSDFIRVITRSGKYIVLYYLHPWWKNIVM